MKAPRMIALALLLAVLACGDSTEPSPEAASLAYVGGAGQSAVVGSPLAQPLTVQVEDQNGEPYPGTTVRWHVTAGGGSVAPSSSTSGSDGIAKAVWTLGNEPGTQEAIGYIAGVDTVAFKATAAPPFSVVLDGTMDSFTLDPETNESRCDYTFTAQATGGATGEYAEWLDGEFQWVKDDEVVDTDPLSEQDVIDFWGASRIDSGETQESSFYSTWTGEFALFLTFRYELTSGELGSVTAGVVCEA